MSTKMKGAAPRGVPSGPTRPGIGLAISPYGAQDHFVSTLVHALAEPLLAAGFGLYTRVVTDVESESSLYREWAASRAVAGVALLGARSDDPRTELLASLGMPFAAVVEAGTDPGFAGVAVDLGASAQVVDDFLGGRGPERAVHIVARDEWGRTDARIIAAAGRFDTVRTDGSIADAVRAAQEAVSGGRDTLIFDSDVHAAEVVSALTRTGRGIPSDVAILSWTDSSLCQSSSPTITAVNRRGDEIGALLGRRVVAVIGGAEPIVDRAPDPFIVLRETT